MTHHANNLKYPMYVHYPYKWAGEGIRIITHICDRICEKGFYTRIHFFDFNLASIGPTALNLGSYINVLMGLKILA